MFNGHRYKRLASACLSLHLLFFSFAVFAEQNDQYTEAQKYKLVNEALAKAVSISDLSSTTLEALIQQKNFNELEKLLANIENNYKKDPGVYEGSLIRSFDSFARIDNKNYETTLANFNQWVTARKSYFAYAARGYYILGEASRYRGTAYIRQTPKVNLLKAEELWDLALDDLRTSIKLSPEFIPAYDQILKISRSNGDHALEEETLAKVLKLAPQTYYIRSNYVEFLQPKWGGTYEEANKFINDAQIYGGRNPQIWRLRGFVASAMAYQYQLDGNYAEAIKMYSEALKYGDRLYWLGNQALVYYRLGNFEAAIENVIRITNYLPNDRKSKAFHLVQIMKAESQKLKKQSFGNLHNPKENQPQIPQSLGWDDFSVLW
jgi:tetratricopeptide (TPR) repeat protein